MECQEVNCKADFNKNWAKSIKYASCSASISKPPKILPARGLRLNKKKQNVNVFMKKCDSKDC